MQVQPLQPIMIMKPITHLKPCEPLVRDSVVETLTYLLELAEKGELQSMACAVTVLDRTSGYFCANVNCDAPGLVFGLERAKLYILDNLD